MTGVIQIQWTASNIEEAQSTVSELLQLQLVACVSLIPNVQSFFRWEGRIENSNEIKVFLKTRRELFSRVKEYILEKSSYDVPEVLLFEVADGNPTYLSWVKSVTQDPV